MLTLGDILDDLNAEAEKLSQDEKIICTEVISDSPVDSFAAPRRTGMYFFYHDFPEMADTCSLAGICSATFAAASN